MLPCNLTDSDPTSPLDLLDLKPFQLPASPVHRARGRPRRQAINVTLEEPAHEPIRSLRSRKRTSNEVSQNPWTSLSNAPVLTPLSPKKNRQARALQRPSKPPVNQLLIYIISANHISRGQQQGGQPDSNRTIW